MKDDEKRLLKAVLDSHGGSYNLHRGKSPRELGRDLGINPKRVRYLCEKWAGRDIYDYGTSCDLGWLTDKGIEVLEKSHESLS